METRRRDSVAPCAPITFFSDSHQRIFRALVRLIGEGIGEPHISILANQLRDSGELEKVGGPAYLAYLTEGLPRSTDLTPYVKKIIGHWHRRQALLVSDQFAATIRSNHLEPDAAIAVFRQKLADVIAVAAPSIKNGSAGVELDITTLANVEARAVEWLWEPYVPIGMLTLMSGEPSAGKSFVSLSIAAELSRGKLLDGNETDPGTTLYLNSARILSLSLCARASTLSTGTPVS